MEPVRLEKTLHLSSSPAELWPLVSNTDRLNRALGLPVMTSSGANSVDYSQQISACLFGVPLRWTETPFDYVEARNYEVTRDFHTGLFTRFQGGLRMSAEQGGTAATLYSAFWPRWTLARPLVRAFAGKAMHDTVKIYGRIDESIQKLGAFPAPPRTMTPIDEDLLAARAGALRAAPVDAAAAERLIAHIRCDSCNIKYGVDLSASVELRFAVHPSVRAPSSAVFCAGSPVHSRHAVAQLRLDGLAQRALDLDLKSQSYTVRCLLSKRAVRLRPSAEGPTTVSIDLSRAANDELAFRPGPVRLLLPASGCPALVRVEKESWREAAATAMLVTTMQGFRDLFSSEVLAPGVEIGVKHLALLFTDLKGSTAMYERVGDATAYALVRDHFDWLTGIIAARRGAVVKTIGDAVMAVFASGADALEAALDMVERIDELSARLAPRPPVVLKIGVHEGPSIAINAGGHLDYFSTMVNVAARVQNESAGGDIVVTRALYHNPIARAVMTRRAPAEERFTIALKGLSGEFELWRLTPRVLVS